MDVQFTLADGFFNRKRGRPPKNRYVQVYKNLQLPPQAVFTSFKLDRQQLPFSSSESNGCKDARGATKKFPTRWQLVPHDNDPLVEGYASLTKVAGQKTIFAKSNETRTSKSVIRPTGTYYPGSSPKIKSEGSDMNATKESLTRQNSTSKSNDNLPEDLSTQKSNEEHLYLYLQMLQTIYLIYGNLPTLPVAESPVFQVEATNESLNCPWSHLDVMNHEFQFRRYPDRQIRYRCPRCGCKYKHKPALHRRTQCKDKI